ncbi:MAG: hypothetical protein JWO62_1233 [Acidimicrobiaceae bacterium]|nr:hypothetical protein [Acidimicrobiaceae bacterium]
MTCPILSLRRLGRDHALAGKASDLDRELARLPGGDRLGHLSRQHTVSILITTPEVVDLSWEGGSMPISSEQAAE